MIMLGCVFFFKQKTAYEVRISDWSSDVCSSDLAVDDELIRLEIVDPIVGPHHAGEIEADAVRAVRFEREDAFGIGGNDAGAIDAQAPALADQPEFDGIPIETRELFQRVELQAAQAALAIGLHIVGEHRVGEHRDMAEDVDRKSTRLNSSH